MITINDSKDCCGCTACANICTHHAINMVEDDLGFKYPKVDNEKCTNCNLCNIVCQFKSNYKRYSNYNIPTVYGARCKNLEEVNKSQTAGAFYAISETILNEGGLIYGAGWDDKHTVIHKRISTKQDREELRGSKYVQSELGDTFKNIKQDLKNGKLILFVGTPCQVAGLRAYIGNKISDNLYTIDLICHGVPSPLVWKKYLNWIEQKYGETIIEAKFRDKSIGWHGCIESFQLESKKIFRNSFPYFFFNKHLSVRQSCSNCHFTNFKRIGDITIGDFWGWEKFYHEWNDNLGVNLVLINSDKGKLLFEKAKINLDIIESDCNKCVQPQLKKPIEISPEQKEFIKDLNTRKFDYILKKYAEDDFLHRLKKRVSAKFPKVIKYIRTKKWK